jgi:ABC-type amino acid transport substrate-binding protein
MQPMSEIVVMNSAKLLAEAAIKMSKDGKQTLKPWRCTSKGSNNNTRNDFETYLSKRVQSNSRYALLKDKHTIPHLLAPIKMIVKLQNTTTTIEAGSWDPEAGFVQASGYQMKKVKRFFRVGIVLGLPWAWVDGAVSPIDSKFMNESQPNRGLVGYCIDLLTRLSTTMDFDYEIIPSSENQYGYKQANGTWTGIVGDLISGEIDISVATLTMTTEREEVIDFVAPYFDQVKGSNHLVLVVATTICCNDD